MFKLVTVGGKLRGQEYILSEGENIVGRDSTCTISLDINGVSKKHFKITVGDKTAFVEDLDSSNGTFVNGKLVKKYTVRDGDKIVLPDIIFQLVYLIEKDVIVKKKVAKAQLKEDDDDDDYDRPPPMPTPLPAKVIHIFKYKLMPVVYTFNKEYEWRSIFAVLLVIFISITIAFTIFPVLVDSKRLLLREIGKRGFYYAKQVATQNAMYLARKDFDAINTRFLDSEPDIESYQLFDLEGRIIRPLSQLNDYITDTFSITAKDMAVKGKSRYTEKLGDGKFGISQTIMAYIIERGDEVPVGIIAIKFAPQSLIMEAANNSKAYLESFITSALIGILFFIIVYFMTAKHFEDFRLQVDRVLRGKQKEVEEHYLLLELKPLRSTVNTILQKYNETRGETSSEFAEIEDDSKYVTILKEFLLGAGCPAMILNSEKLIEGINSEAEEVTGIRESIGSGMSLLDVSRDQGFAATAIDLCDQSANNDGVSQKGSYELSGVEYSICITSLMGKDNFAKAFYITFIKEE